MIILIVQQILFMEHVRNSVTQDSSYQLMDKSARTVGLMGVIDVQLLVAVINVWMVLSDRFKLMDLSIVDLLPKGVHQHMLLSIQPSQMLNTQMESQ